MLAILRDKFRQWHLPGSPSGDLPVWGEVLAGGCGGASQVHSSLLKKRLKLLTHLYTNIYEGDVHESSGDC